MKVVGTKVVRGKGWQSGDDDGTSSSTITQVGTVFGALDWREVVGVAWPNTRMKYHKMGRDGIYELQLAGT